MLAALAGRIYDYAPQQSAFPLGGRPATVDPLELGGPSLRGPNVVESSMRLPFLRVAIVVGSTVLATALRAQCPNGTPPPCSATRGSGAGATGTTPAPNSVAVLYFDARDTADVSLARSGVRRVFRR